MIRKGGQYADRRIEVALNPLTHFERYVSIVPTR